MVVSKMIYQTLLSAAVIACMLFSEPIVCLASTQNVAKIKDILCVLILNGVEKEDLDENTLRKLEKMHVNINDWNNVYKRDCEKNIGLAQPGKNRGDHWTAFRTELPLTSTTDETVVTKPSNLIQLPKLEEMLNNFQTTNISDAEKGVARKANHVQVITKPPEQALNNNDNLDNVLNFWNQFRQNKEKLSTITTTTAAAYNKQSDLPEIKNAQIEKPKMFFEHENASRITEFVNTNNDYSIEPPQPILTTGQPNFNKQFSEYTEFFDVMYKKFLGLKNHQNQNQNHNGFKNEFSFNHDFQNIPPKESPTTESQLRLADMGLNTWPAPVQRQKFNNEFNFNPDFQNKQLKESPTTESQLRLADMGLNTWPAPVQRPYATAMSVPLHILHVKPIKISYMQSESPIESEINRTHIYSETVKEIANEVKSMLLAQLKKEIPLIISTPSTDAPTTTTTTTTMLPIAMLSKPIQSLKTNDPLSRDRSLESSETRKKLEETNGMVKKLFGLFQKLEVVQKKAFSTFRPMPAPVPAPRFLPSPSLSFLTTSTSKPTQDAIYRAAANKNTAMNINNRLDPYQNLPTFNNMPYNNMPYHNMQYNSMQYSMLPPKPMSPYLPMPRQSSYPKQTYNTNPPKMYNNPYNPIDLYNYKMIKPSMVAINAKMIQTNEFIVMPLRVPINVKGARADVQRLIDNQNIILNNTLQKIIPTTTTTTTTPSTTTQNYDTPSKPPERNNYEWVSKKNTNLENSREREKFIDSMDRERTFDSREREKTRYNSREGRVDRTHESLKVSSNYHHLPRSHFKKTSQLLSERDHYERHPAFQSDENPIHNKYHDDYKGPRYQPDQMYLNPHLHGHKVDYHPHAKKALDDTREPVRDDPSFYNREPPREKPKFFNRDSVKEDHQFLNREPLPIREEHKHFNREPPRDEPKHFNRADDFDRELPRNEEKFYNMEPRSESQLHRDHSRQPKVFNLEPPRVKYEKQAIHDPREPAEPLAISDSFEKLINGESVESIKDYPHRDIAPINKPPAKASNFSEKHFKNFLSTQQKVNSMLEKILSAKTQGARLR